MQSIFLDSLKFEIEIDDHIETNSTIDKKHIEETQD